MKMFNIFSLPIVLFSLPNVVQTSIYIMCVRHATINQLNFNKQFYDIDYNNNCYLYMY
eukprot:GAHX01004072.1.p1 GENE.GAHX01004072.1~~GAHX01004072.1.p1  ORF type:complete len:58 (-),score=1.48 GAHX01004072.1:34-207(-)